MRAIKPNDIILHKPSGKQWVVCGVDLESGTLIPKGYPFSTRAEISDCELLEERYELEPQSVETIRALLKHGLELQTHIQI